MFVFRNTRVGTQEQGKIMLETLRFVISPEDNEIGMIRVE